MKTFQCKKSLLAVGLAAALASTSALGFDFPAAPSEGSSVGHFDVNANVLSEVQVANLEDVTFTDIDPIDTSAKVQDMSNVCFYSSAFNGATVSASSLNGGNVGQLLDSSSGETLAYEVHLLDATNQNEIADDLFALGATGMSSGDEAIGVQTSPCDSTGLGVIRVKLLADLDGRIAGNYSDTVEITIVPNV